MPCRIEVTPWELPVRVGCHAEERAQPQPLQITLSVTAGALSSAATSDRLADTWIDAGKLVQAVNARLAEGANTLEYLAAQVEAGLRANFPVTGLVWELRLTKPRMGWSYVQTWRT